MADVGKVVFAVLEVLIAIACCVGNALVVWAVRRLRKRREATYCFMASLAAADFLVGAVAAPLAVLLNEQVETRFEVCLVTGCTVLMLTHSSILSLLAMAVDRYLRVSMPIKYRSVFSPWCWWVTVAVCWLIAAMLSFAPALWCSTPHTPSSPTNSSTTVCSFLVVIPMPYLFYFSFITFTLLPLATMTLLYTAIFCIIQRRFQDHSPGSHSYYRKELHLARSLALVLLLFALFWLPLHTMNSISYFGGTIPQELFYVGILLSHASSATNPIVYGFRMRGVRETYLQAWERLSQRKWRGEERVSPRKQERHAGIAVG